MGGWEPGKGGEVSYCPILYAGTIGGIRTGLRNVEHDGLAQYIGNYFETLEATAGGIVRRLCPSRPPTASGICGNSIASRKLAYFTLVFAISWSNLVPIIITG